MKSLKIIIALFVIAMVYVACTQDNTATPASNTSNFILGNWTVSSFIKDSVDISGQFSEYTFTCTKNGGMSIQGNSKIYTCNWKNMSNIDSTFHFQVMGCGPNSVLLECADDWDLTRYDSLHCYFSSHNSNRHTSMNWTKKQ